MLLEAARQLDESPRWFTRGRRPVVATLLFAGPRAGELCALRWRDIDLDNRRIHIGRSKTQAGLREITLLPVLHTELTAHKTATPFSGLDDPVFATSKGTPHCKDNLRERIVAPVLRRADELLAARDRPSLPAGVSPHKLRHTYASILIAVGEDPASVMAQLGHTDPSSRCASTPTSCAATPKNANDYKRSSTASGTRSRADTLSRRTRRDAQGAAAGLMLRLPGPSGAPPVRAQGRCQGQLAHR